MIIPVHNVYSEQHLKKICKPTFKDGEIFVKKI